MLSNLIIALTGAIGMFLVFTGRTDTKNLITAAQNSATALQATQNVASNGQRAWLAIGDARANRKANELDVGVFVTNVGKSPAIEVIGNISLYINDQKHPLPYRNAQYPTKDINAGTLFPNARFNVVKQLQFPLHTPYVTLFKNVKNGSKVIYVIAKVNYRDIFGKSHWTHFCAILTPDLAVANKCQFYNDSDP